MRDCLTERGFEVVRGAGSKGCDLIAGRNGKTYAIEVKNTKTLWSGFGPARRQEMRRMCKSAGWIGVLVHFAPGESKPTIAFENVWPD